MDSTAPPAMDGQGQGPPPPQQQQQQQQHQQQYVAYDPRSNGLTRQPTEPLDPHHQTPRSQSLTPQDRTEGPVRSMTDPMQNDQQMQPKPKRSGKICGKCGEGLTGQFVRALGGTYHLECFTCHVCAYTPAF